MVRTFAISGLYPRREQLVKASWDHDKGLLTPAKLDAEYLAAAREVVTLQERLGAGTVTDGNLTWHDAFRGLTESSSGLGADSVTRLFETNRFFRQPVVTAAPKLDAQKFAQHLLLQRIKTPAPKRAVLPSPYWFARVARDETGRDGAATARDLARLVNQAASWLSGQGYAEVVFNEPQLFYETSPDLKLASELFSVALKGVKARTTLNFARTNIAEHAEWVFQQPADAIGVDFVETYVDDLPKAKKPVALQAAVVDSQESLLESAEEVDALVSSIEKRLKPTALTLTATGDLETVPTPVAEKKLAVLARAARPEVLA